MNQEQIETQLIGLLTKYLYAKGLEAQLTPSVINDLKLILLYKLIPISRHHHLSHMSELVLILWQGAYNIA
ncbi:hypothetical protein D3C85_1467050 [compost metagenome]